MNIDTFRKLALALPDATEAPHHHFTSFRVDGKIFATVPPENTHAHLFVDDDARERALVLHADCVEVLMWGGKASGLRLQLSKTKAAAANALLREAWLHKVPEQLQARELP